MSISGTSAIAGIAAVGSAKLNGNRGLVNTMERLLSATRLRRSPSTSVDQPGLADLTLPDRSSLGNHKSIADAVKDILVQEVELAKPPSSDELAFLEFQLPRIVD